MESKRNNKDRIGKDEAPEPAAPRLDESRFGPLNTEPPFNEIRTGMAWALRECAQDEDYESYPPDLEEFVASVAKISGITTKLLGEKLTACHYNGHLPRSKKDLFMLYVRNLCPGIER